MSVGTVQAKILSTGIPGTKGHLWLLDDTTGDFLKIGALDNAYSANRTLSIDLGNQDRVLTISGASGVHPTISDWFDQSVKTTADPTFDDLTLTGKLIAGTFASPIDVTNTREYGFEIHYSGNDYNATGIRSRASAVTTDTSAQFQGGLFQAANRDNIDVGVLNGIVAEAIGKSTANASTIAMMRGGLIGAEWDAFDTVTQLNTLHVRVHSRNAAGAGSFGDGYGVYIENEAVGGNGQALDAGIYFKGTNLSAGNKAFTYGIDFSGATFATAEIKFSNGETIDNLTDGQLDVNGILKATSFKVSSTIDHDIYDSSDDLYIRNLNEDKDIIFSVNDGATQKDFITVDSSKPALMLDPGTVTAVLGLIDCTGTFTAGNSYVLNFHPAYSGAGGISGLNVDIDITATGNAASQGIAVLGNTNASQSSGTQTLYGVRLEPDLKNSAAAAVAYGTYFHPAQVILTNATTRNVYGNYLKTTTTTTTAGTVNQYGVYLTGWGVINEVGGTINSYAIYSDGAQSVHAGYLRIGSTVDPTVALDVTGDVTATGLLDCSQITVGDLTLSTTDSHTVIASSTMKTGGVTDATDNMVALDSSFVMNQSGGIIGNMYGLTSFGYLADGDIGTGAASRSLWGAYSEIEQDAGTTVYGSAYGSYYKTNLDGGTVTVNAYGLLAQIDQEAAHTISGDAYGAYVDVDSDGTVTGDTYMLYLNEQTGVDYGIYQNGTATNILGGITRVGTAANYSEFELDGTLVFNGTATVWDDLVMPFTLARVPAANAPNWESFIGNLNAYTFADGDFLEGTTELLHGWKEGSTISWHIHWATNGTEGTEKAVEWEIEYTFADMDSTGVGEAFGATTTDSTETAIPLNTPDLTHMYTVMETTALTTEHIGAQLLWRVRRITAVGTAPAANPFGLAVGIHMEKDTVGSRLTETK